MTDTNENVPLYATQGGGTATYRNGQYVWHEVPTDFPEFKVGDPIPEKWSTVPINEAALDEMECDYQDEYFPDPLLPERSFGDISRSYVGILKQVRSNP